MSKFGDRWDSTADLSLAIVADAFLSGGNPIPIETSVRKIDEVVVCSSHLAGAFIVRNAAKPSTHGGERDRAK